VRNPRAYKTDLGADSLVNFHEISVVLKNPSKTKLGNTLQVVLNNGVRLFLSSPDADDFFRDYREFLEGT